MRRCGGISDRSAAIFSFLFILYILPVSSASDRQGRIYKVYKFYGGYDIMFFRFRIPFGRFFSISLGGSLNKLLGVIGKWRK